MLVVIEEMLLKVLQPMMLLPKMLSKKKSSEKSEFCRMLHSILKACIAKNGPLIAFLHNLDVTNKRLSFNFGKNREWNDLIKKTKHKYASPMCL